MILIDDEQTILQGLTRLIDWPKHNFQLIGTFSKPLEALAFFKHNRVDIVITDLMMPELNGIELSKQFKKLQPDVQILVLSSYDDFSFVKDSFKEGAADYLLKPTLNPDNLLSALQALAKNENARHIPVQREEWISRVISDYLSGLAATLILTKKDFLHPLFFLLYTESISEYQQFNSHTLTVDIPSYANEHLQLFAFETMDHEAGYLINADSMEALALFCQQFKQKQTVNECLFILSSAFALHELSRHFAALRKCKGQGFYISDTPLICIDELPTLLSNYETDTKAYLTMIINKDYFQAIADLKRALTALVNAKAAPSFLKHEMINRFYALLAALADDYEKDEFFSMKQTIPIQLAEAKHIRAFSDDVFSAIDMLEDLLSPVKTDNSEILTLICEYIQENCEKELSLQTISEKYYFSYSYLSTLFTEKYGVSFTKYVKKVRIRKAKKLLFETNDSLSEICEKIGFSELGYFSRVFKEETGLTPSQYRKGLLVK
ncbi:MULTISPECIES: response regulator [unclassified Enterococcus]|uniref:response regulator n=1 Tax=unclassified Enterococcus TaxID=2608891 RepID=UPI001F156259|nr:MULTISPECIES: response regulator [unclassified Enterococcus]